MDAITIRCELDGEPIGKGRPKFAMVRGFPRVYTPAHTAKYEKRLQTMARHAMGNRPPVEGGIAITVLAVFALRDSWPKWKRREAMAQRLRPTTKPDADNILKIALDGLNAIVFRDDVQVVEARVIKIYGARPRLSIEVTPLDEQHAPADARQQPVLPLEGAAA